MLPHQSSNEIPLEDEAFSHPSGAIKKTNIQGRKLPDPPKNNTKKVHFENPEQPVVSLYLPFMPVVEDPINLKYPNSFRASPSRLVASHTYIQTDKPKAQVVPLDYDDYTEIWDHPPESKEVSPDDLKSEQNAAAVVNVVIADTAVNYQFQESLDDIVPETFTDTQTDRKVSTIEPVSIIPTPFMSARRKRDPVAVKAPMGRRTRIVKSFSKQSKKLWALVSRTFMTEKWTLKEHRIAAYLNKHPKFLDQYMMNHMDSSMVETIYARKYEIQNPLCNNKRTKNGEDVYEVLDMLPEEPTELELMCELTPPLRKALYGKAHRVIKLEKAKRGKTPYAEVLTIATTKNRPTLLSWKKIEISMNIIETYKNQCCMYFNNRNKPLDIVKFSTTLFEEIGTTDTTLDYVVCVPIFGLNKDINYIVEVWRSTKYDRQDIKIAENFMIWCSITIHFSAKIRNKTYEKHFTQILLQTVKCVFEEIGSYERVIRRILKFAQRLVNADRASLFIVDYKNGELVSNVFDMKWTDLDTFCNNQREIRIPINKGIAGNVAVTGESLNIIDAYSDDRFNRAVDESTGYKTTSMLCLPIKVGGKVIAVVQMVNKRSQSKFGASDESSFNLFSSFFGLALQHANLYDEIVRKEHKYKIALEVLSYHSTCRESEVDELANFKQNYTYDFECFYLDPSELNDIEKCQAVIDMFKILAGKKNFERMNLIKFILTVKKNYRYVKYHNFDHGWSVAQAMFAIIKRDNHRFSYKERLALFVACFCHDLDHRGYTNKYMSEIASPLAAMYTTSTLEHHHFNTTVAILQQEGHNIFSRFTSKEYKEILSLIKVCILATDLAMFFPNLKKLQQLHNAYYPMYSWNNTEHRELAMAISMTAADLSTSVKPFPIQIKIVNIIFEEFYLQGDKERAAGRKPIAMMDRNKPEKQPSTQVEFIQQICLPCYGMLKILLPATEPMYRSVEANLAIWQQAAEVVSLKKLQDQKLEALQKAEEHNASGGTLSDTIPKLAEDVVAEVLITTDDYLGTSMPSGASPTILLSDQPPVAEALINPDDHLDMFTSP